MAPVRRRKPLLQQQQQRGWIDRQIRARVLSFKGFVALLLALSLLGLGPSFVFHLRLKRLAAFNLALKLPVDCIEIDASRTRDGVLVALHDRDLQSFYNNDYLQVGDFTLDEIARLDVGYRYPKEFQNQMIPSLAESLQHVSRFLKHVIIDAKIGPSMSESSLAADILAVVNDTQCQNCIIWSKSDSFIQELKLLAPKVLAGYIVMIDRVSGKVMDPLRLKEEVVGAYHGVVNTRIVADIHRAGKKVYVWTVDAQEVMERMIFEGVDGIVTSYPQLLFKIMMEMEEWCKQEGYLL